MAAVTVPVDDEVRADLRTFGKAWWLFLVAGVLWLVVGFMILSFDLTSITLISVGFAVVLLLAAVEEAVMVALADGWRWLHAVLAVVFAVGGAFALAYPGQTFRTLAILIGWFLLIKGTATFCVSLMVHGTHLWWLGLITGLIEIALGIWALGYPGRSAALLILWAGFAAVFHGVSDIVMAFQVREMKKELSA